MMWCRHRLLRSIELRQLLVFDCVAICGKLSENWAWFGLLYFVNTGRRVETIAGLFVFPACVDKRIHVLLHFVLDQECLLLILFWLVLLPLAFLAITILVFGILLNLRHAAEILFDIEWWVQILWNLLCLADRQLLSVRELYRFDLRVGVHDFWQLILVKDRNGFW